jgi:hypothetical protein
MRRRRLTQGYFSHPPMSDADATRIGKSGTHRRQKTHHAANPPHSRTHPKRPVGGAWPAPNLAPLSQIAMDRP